MIKLIEHKHPTEDKPIENAPLPAKAYIHLSQHLGKPCSPDAKIGDTVFAGQKIGSAQAHVYAPVHASISGKISAIQDWPHPVSGKGKAIVIESDGLDKSPGHSLDFARGSLRSQVIPSTSLGAPFGLRSPDQVNKMTPDEIRKAVFEAGVVGMGGAAFPTHIKLNPPKPVDTLIVNGAECEPYLTGDYRMMLEKTKEIMEGISVIQRCLGVKNVYIAIEDNKPQAIKKLNDAIRNTQYAVRILKTMYPQGGEKQLIKNVLGKEVPQGKLPLDVGVVVQNVSTIFAVYEAVYLGKPLYERLVTVTGTCLANPKNLLARIGTPIKELIDCCGPLKADPVKVIVGGPMMGIAQFSLDTAVIKSTNGVVLLSEKEAKVLDEEYCIRCGACVRECPMRLMPCLINLSSEKEMWQEARKYGASDCIECGVCNYICPANRRLVQSIKRAKLELSKTAK